MLLNLLSKVFFKGKIDIIDYKGKIHSFGTSTPYVKIKFNNKLTERKIFFNPDLYIGEAYMNKDLTIEEGSINDFINIISASYADIKSNHWLLKFIKNISTIFRSFQPF